ncbi:hypothetical protein MMC09_000552 [Bachmanniomyces sp. S44760]|nr:hypothetical protein [Bachmanniomyces sp. S44760]
MPGHEIIDLCQSTDEDGDDLQLPVLSKEPFADPRISQTFSFLSEHTDSDLVLDTAVVARSPKRRRLSLSSSINGDTTEKSIQRDVIVDGSDRVALEKPIAKKNLIEKTIDLDPIDFTSLLAPMPSRSRPELLEPAACSQPTSVSEDEFDLNTILRRSRCEKSTALSDRTTALLAKISGNSRPRCQRNPSIANDLSVETFSRQKQAKLRRTGSGASLNSAGRKLEPSERPKQKTSVNAIESNNEKDAKAREKAQTKAQREKDKDIQKERRRLDKEQKAQEKQVVADLAEVNKIKTDKKLSTPEMIVDLPASIEGTRVDTQTRELLKGLQVEVGTLTESVPKLVRWRRKVTAQFNEEMGHWEPCPQAIKTEKHVICLVAAEEFVAMASADPAETDGQDLETHILNVKRSRDDCQPIYLIEGLLTWSRKNKTIANRAYQAAARAQGALSNEEPQASSQSQKSRRKKPAAEHIDEDMIEDALLRLQVSHECLVHHTATPLETAEWIANFTQHISTIPYRIQKMNLETSFCMDVGQVKTGENKDDTYIKMLQEVVRVTAPIAYGIYAQYPSVTSLVKGFERIGPTALENLKKSANKNGALTESRIGPALSKRLYKVFMDTDPASTDV